MASSSLAICKRAAQILGAGQANLTSIDTPSTYEDTEFAAAYETVRDAELRKHRWNFAKKTTVLSADTIGTITGITQANPAVVTCASHGFSDGDTVYIDGVVGMSDINQKTYTVANKTTDTFELSGVNSAGYVAYSSGGRLFGYVPWPYDFRFALPSDCLAVIRAQDTYDFDIEQGYLHCNTDDPLPVEYVGKITDTTQFDPLFDEALAAAIAVELCETITQSNTKKDEAERKYEDKVRWARRTNAIERGPDSRSVPPLFVAVRG